jgi:hypothetical protein
MKRLEAIRRAVEAHPYCPHCGATNGLQTHHRASRGMGGSKAMDRFDNLLRVCAQLNYAMEADAAVASQARDMGWKLGRWDGFDAPYFDRVAMQWFVLTENGQKIACDPPNYLI